MSRHFETLAVNESGVQNTHVSVSLCRKTTALGCKTTMICSKTPAPSRAPCLLVLVGAVALAEATATGSSGHDTSANPHINTKSARDTSSLDHWGHNRLQ